jgi:hypothetical protein
MELSDLFLYDLITKKKYVDLFSKNAFTGFCTKHSCALFMGFVDRQNIKYFHITDTTRERIGNLPTDKIKGSTLIDLVGKQSSGLVYFSDGLHFIYCIRKNGVYLLVSRERKKKSVVEDPGFYIGNIMSGFLYFDFIGDFSQCYINNVLDIQTNEDTLFVKDKRNIPLLKSILKEIELNGSNSSLVQNQRIDYDKKYNDTRLCLQAFMFIHFAKVINSTRISFQNDDRTIREKILKKPIYQKPNDIIVVDTLYDETIKVINPFSVSGHFRNQPFGKERSDKKMIYIDSFMKSGYTRIATKEKLNI